MGYKRKSITASNILHRQYKGQRNFITPDRLKIGKINKNVAYELSSGSGILDREKRMYGVSVVSFNPKKYTTKSQWDLSKPFDSKNDAEAYINKLKRMMNLNRKRRK